MYVVKLNKYIHYHYLLQLMSEKLNLTICRLKLTSHSNDRLTNIQTVHDETHHFCV